MQMSTVFAYGTLRPGQVNYPLVSAAVGEHVPARLAGHALRATPTAGFPYATVADDHRIVGDLLQLTPGTDVLSVLDRLEGYRPEEPDLSHYVRVPRDVATTAASGYGPAGTVVQAWVYLAGPCIRIDGLDLIADGDWTTRCPDTQVRRWS